MNLTAEQIIENWETFLEYIETYITGERKEQLLKFYKKYEDRFQLMPAAHKAQYHNCFPGGYIEHVNRVIQLALEFDKTWRSFGVKDTYTTEELVFAALNHDLGKFGDFDHPAHLDNDNEWEIKNRGELYKFNDALQYMTVPDRSIWLLTQLGIKMSSNEMLAIKLHDGLYDPTNEPYLKTWMPETKPRTSLIHIVHQADFAAARIEFERQWLDKFGKPKEKSNNFALGKGEKKESKPNVKTKALGNVKSNSLANLLNNL